MPLAFWPISARTAAIYALVVVAAIARELIAWETTTLAAARDRIRHSVGRPAPP